MIAPRKSRSHDRTCVEGLVLARREEREDAEPRGDRRHDEHERELAHDPQPAQSGDDADQDRRHREAREYGAESGARAQWTVRGVHEKRAKDNTGVRKKTPQPPCLQVFPAPARAGWAHGRESVTTYRFRLSPASMAPRSSPGGATFVTGRRGPLRPPARGVAASEAVGEDQQRVEIREEIRRHLVVVDELDPAHRVVRSEDEPRDVGRTVRTVVELEPGQERDSRAPAARTRGDRQDDVDQLRSATPRDRRRRRRSRRTAPETAKKGS